MIVYNVSDKEISGFLTLSIIGMVIYWACVGLWTLISAILIFLFPTKIVSNYLMYKAVIRDDLISTLDNKSWLTQAFEWGFPRAVPDEFIRTVAVAEGQFEHLTATMAREIIDGTWIYMDFLKLSDENFVLAAENYLTNASIFEYGNFLPALSDILTSWQYWEAPYSIVAGMYYHIIVTPITWAGDVWNWAYTEGITGYGLIDLIPAMILSYFMFWIALFIPAAIWGGANGLFQMNKKKATAFLCSPILYCGAWFVGSSLYSSFSHLVWAAV